MEWKSVYIFISSTFNDMHAERDLLIKRVFPELRAWCAKRHLKLIDVDLRWGVSEEDASENKRVVDICLQNIDKCQPFFLSFLGQRRGWVPELSDINEETFEHFPLLKDYLGQYSITELEILHAIFHPMNEERTGDTHALFYFRDPSYLADMEGVPAQELFAPGSNGKEELEKFKETISKTYKTFVYTAKWDKELMSPEVANIAGVNYSKGRLRDFAVDGVDFESHITEGLKEAISKAFPEHMELFNETGALSEADVRGVRLYEALDAYINRPEQEQQISDYLCLDSTAEEPYILIAGAGTGKTSLLSYFIEREKEHCIYRFAGISTESSDSELLIKSIYEELCEKNYINEEAKKEGLEKGSTFFEGVLRKIPVDKKVVIIIDGIDQFAYDKDAYWIPFALPKHVKMIISISSDAKEMAEAIKASGHETHLLTGLNEETEKRQMIQGYLGQFLKAVDEKQIGELMKMQGSANPLFLKIVLNELRQFGSFEGVNEKLSSNFGNNPVEGFGAVLERIEHEKISPLVESFFLKIYLEAMALSLEGIKPAEAAEVFCKLYGGASKQAYQDAFVLLEKYLYGYLSIKGETVDFLYNSLRRAILLRYAKNESMAREILIAVYKNRFDKCDAEVYLGGQNSDIYNLARYLSDAKAINTLRELFAPGFMLRFCRSYGTGVLAGFYENALKSGLLEKYSQNIINIITVLRGMEAEIFVNPEALFEELEARCEESNNLAKNIAAKAKEAKNISYLHVVNPDRTTFRPLSRIIYPGDGFRRLSDNYIVNVPYASSFNSPSYVKLLSKKDCHIERMFTLPKHARVNYAEGTHFYVIYSDLSYEVYELPSFQVVSSGEAPVLEEGYKWNFRIHGYRGRLYAQAVCSTEEAVSVKLYWLNADTEEGQEKLLYTGSSPAVAGEFNSAPHILYQKNICFSVDEKTGHVKMFLLFPFKELDDFDIGGSKMMSQYAAAKAGKHLYFIYEKGDKMRVRLYTKKGFFHRLVSDSELPGPNPFSASSFFTVDKRLGMTRMDQAFMYDPKEDLQEFQCVGIMQLPFDAGHDGGKQGVFIPNEDTMLHFGEGSVLSTLDKKEFQKGYYLPTKRQVISRVRDVGIREDGIVIYAGEDALMDMETGELKSLGTCMRPNRVVYKRLPFSDSEYEQSYYNLSVDGILYSVINTKQSIEKTFVCSDGQARSMRYKQVWVYTENETGELNKIYGPVLCREHSFDIEEIHGEIYLVCGDRLKDDQTKVMCIIRVKDGTCVFEREILPEREGDKVVGCDSKDYMLLKESVGEWENGEKYSLVHTVDLKDFSVKSMKQDYYTFGSSDGNKFFYSVRTGKKTKIQIYDMAEHCITHEFFADTDYTWSKAFCKGKYFFVTNADDVCRIYDIETGKKVFHQALNSSQIYNVPDDKHILLQETGGNIRLLELILAEV